MPLAKPAPESRPEELNAPASCAVCGRECSAAEINFKTLCDAHFDAWLKLDRPNAYTSASGSGAKAQMADFIATAKLSPVVQPAVTGAPQ